jgi:alanyl-tRNA synthetase
MDSFKGDLICIQNDEPIAILMGGSPASGKSTFLRKYAPYLLKEEILKVEEMVNAEIHKGSHVDASVMSMDQAVKKGAMALFGEKYGNEVRVLTMGEFSTELCGGTHVSNTGDISLFTILSESSLATGVRRIEATTSETALNYLSHRSSLYKKVEALFNDKDEKALVKIENLLKDLKDKQKEIEALSTLRESIETENDKLKELQQELGELVNKQKEISEQKQY